MSVFVKGLFLAFVILVLDQWSKLYVFGILEGLNPPVIELTSFLNFVMVYNYGVSFGMFDSIANGDIILSAVAIIITIVLFVWMYKVKELHLGIALGLIIGGAIGNIVDRIRVGAVADFIDFYVGNYHWPAFNVADSAVCVGVFILLIDSFISKESKEKEDV